MSSRFGKYALIWLAILATIYIGDRFIRGVLLTQETPRVVSPRGDLGEIEQHTIALFENAAPSVVYIFTQSAPSQIGGEVRGGAGSGFIWDAAGHIVTNHHVVAGAARVGVRLNDGDIIPAQVVGSSLDHDLAVVRLGDNRAQLRPIPIGTSNDLKVGQSVYAIGNPYGLSRTLTTGIISALGRRLPTVSNREIDDVIQTDAPINPGNSGGPLLDSAGRLIGVNTAILSGTGSFAGIGFAVPVDTVNRVVPALIGEGRVPRPGIGIGVLPEEVAARLGASGLVVAEVIPNSSAAQAGLQGINPATGQLGDVITHVNGVEVQTLPEFADMLTKAGIDNEVELTIVRDGQKRTTSLRVMDIGR